MASDPSPATLDAFDAWFAKAHPASVQHPDYAETLMLRQECREVWDAAIAFTRSEIAPLTIVVWKDGSYNSLADDDVASAKQDPDFFASIPLVPGFAPSAIRQLPRAMGVGRMLDNDKAIIVHFTRSLTDDELRELHDNLAGR